MTNIEYDFLMEKVDDYYVGNDKNCNRCFGFVNPNSNEEDSVLVSESVSLEYNAKVISLSPESEILSLTVLTYIGTDKSNESTFEEICKAFFKDTSSNNRERVVEVFYLLNKFFNSPDTYSDSELQGLFAELYTIYSFKDYVNLAKYWQSKEMMNFDFSFSATKKLEIKSTLKHERKHHFKHEQLSTELYDVTVISYMLRDDDSGLSLYDLIELTIPLVEPYPKKLYKLKKILHDVSIERLSDFRYDETYILENRRLFSAFDIPKFDELTPDGVANAEYDCLLEGVKGLSGKLIESKVKQIINES